MKNATFCHFIARKTVHRVTICNVVCREKSEECGMMLNL